MINPKVNVHIIIQGQLNSLSLKIKRVYNIDPFIMDWNYGVVHKTLMNNLNLAVLHIGQQKSYMGQESVVFRMGLNPVVPVLY